MASLGEIARVYSGICRWSRLIEARKVELNSSHKNWGEDLVEKPADQPRVQQVGIFGSKASMDIQV